MTRFYWQILWDIWGFYCLYLLTYYIFTYNIECLHLYAEFCVHAYTIYTYQIPVLYYVKFYTWFIFNTNSSTRFCKVERFGNSSSASLVSRALWGQNLFKMAFIWIFQKGNNLKHQWSSSWEPVGNPLWNLPCWVSGKLLAKIPTK